MMKHLFKGGIVLIFFVVAIRTVEAKAWKSDYPEALKQLHKNVIKNILEHPANTIEVKNLLEDLKDDGSWPDIDYTSKQRGGWPAAGHISNMLTLAKAYRTKDNPYYHKKRLRKKILLALGYWLTNDFQCPNWWYPEIGVPKLLAPVMILMEDELTEEQKNQGIKILDRAKIRMTGQNKVWLSGNVLLKSLLLRDAETIRKASTSIQEELVVSTKEGVQPDWSYHQHGPQIQFGNYGLAYVDDMIKWITILRGTPFQFNEEKVAILRNYLLHGQQWITWKGAMDISACGRQLFVDSPVQKAHNLSELIQKMETLDPKYAGEYRKANQYQSLSGNKHFWRSDFQVERTPEYYFSVKMCSERVIGAESCNSENIQGYYMGDGASFLYQTGQEYNNIFPFWDWKKIPGTTTQQDDKPLPVLTCSGYRIESSFVGGVSNGQNGIAVMRYIRDGLKANKSWFMFEGKIVCLGSGISSYEGFPVTTSVNQSFLEGEPLVESGGREFIPNENENLENPKWILHDSIGYFFPNGGNLKLQTKTVEGSWKRVALRYEDKKLYSKIFKLWFDHGINPADQSYAYIMVPRASKTALEEMEQKDPFRIINHENFQEVQTSSGSTAGVIFYEAGKSEVFGGCEVTEPCVVMLKKVASGIQLSVADPTEKLSEIGISIDGHFQIDDDQVTTNFSDGVTNLKVKLPTEAQAGKTVTVFMSEI